MHNTKKVVSADQQPFRIGELAHQLEVTTRTLRYWQEIGLIQPSGQRDETAGERLYTGEDVERAIHIRELQNLFGFTLAEIKGILEAEDTLADIGQQYHSDSRPERRQELIHAALETNTRLLQRVETKLALITSYRDQLASKVTRLKKKIDSSTT
jgi:DNA-binding transcriptional MerR regulator